MNSRERMICDIESMQTERLSPTKQTIVNSVNTSIPDVQNTSDTRLIAIQRVGVKNVRYPIRLKTPDGVQSSIATWNLYVQLPETKKGTHMSRFIALLEKLGASDSPPLDIDLFGSTLHEMIDLLEAKSGRIEVSMPYFITKTAPVSGVRSLMDYEVSLTGEIHEGKIEILQKVLVPVTSLCPCSKKIAAYGAHNQRSHIIVNALLASSFPFDELIAKIEAQASCELYGLLKRPDEKYVTERAYDNPKFVEDLVRDVAGMLNADDRVIAYTLEAENFESIHNHSAYAMIENDKRMNKK